MTYIAIVDDHPIVRDGIKRLLIDAGIARSVETFERAEELIAALARSHRIDLCIMDVGLPGIGGIEAITELSVRWPDLPIVVLTAQPAESVVVRCLRSGARGFISKGQDPSELFDAIRTVLRGGRAVDSRFIDLLLREVDGKGGSQPHERLSNREFVIMRKIAAGESIQSIARDLCLSPKTVSTYRRRCLEKMGFTCNAQLTEYVLRTFDESAVLA